MNRDEAARHDDELGKRHAEAMASLGVDVPHTSELARYVYTRWHARAIAAEEIIDTMTDRMGNTDMQAPEDAAVEALCERHGYGAVMDAAARLWARKDPVGALVVGPCRCTIISSIKARRKVGR